MTHFSYSDTLLQTQRQQLISNQNMAKHLELIGEKIWSMVTNEAYDTTVKPDITILISNYNYGNFIIKALDSVCHSNLNGLSGGVEILVIDDASKDDSVQQVADYLKQSRIPLALVKNKLNTGTAQIRNLGLKLARANYIFILDADNYIYPNCLVTLYSNIISSNSAAAYSIINKFDVQTNEGCGLLSQYNWDTRQLLRYPYIDAMALFDKKVLLELGGYPTELIHYGWLGWEDYYIWLKLAQRNYNVKFVPEILSVYRLHHARQTSELSGNFDALVTHFENQFLDLMRLHQDLDRRFGIVSDFEGHLDTTNGECVSGWVYNKQCFTIPTRVDFFCGNKLVGSILAQQFRRDLFEQRIGTGYHGFIFTLPQTLKDGKPHQLSAHFCGKSEQLIGSPMTVLYYM